MSMFDKFKIWIPLVGVYFVAIDKEIVQSKKIGMLFVHIFFGLVILIMVSDPQPPVEKVVKDEPKEVVEEKKTEPETDMNELAVRVDKLSKGKGKDWLKASDQEKAAFCIVTAKELLQTSDKNKVVELCGSITSFYGQEDMLDQNVKHIAIQVATFMKF